MNTKYLALSWSISRGRDTYGYNICRLDDTCTDRRFKCMGGGYDMTGTVFGEWLEANYQGRLLTASASSKYGARLVVIGGISRIRLDGACGIETMRTLAELIGLDVNGTHNRKGHSTGFMVADTQA